MQLIFKLNSTIKEYHIVFLSIVLLIFLSACNTKKDKPESNDSSTEESLYLGLKPPGMTPELFAPDIVSTNNLEIEGVFSPSMDEFYFTRQVKGEVPKTHAIRYENGAWKKFMEEPRSGEIFISTDNKTMYLGNRYRERTTSGWSAEKSLDPLFEQFSIMRLTASSIGTYVFDEREENGTIRHSRLKDGKREASKAFGKEINTGKMIGHPFIAPDESYIIWDSDREGGYGKVDLYISFRQESGSWGPAINMGKKINTKIDDAFGSITSDGNYFIFHRVELGEESYAKIFWVDAQIIKNLKNK